MKKVMFWIVATGMLLSVCRAFAIELATGKDYFLRTPLYAAKDKDNQINWINYSDVAEKLRAGEKVTIIEIKGNVVKFLLNNKLFTFEFTQKGLAGTPGVYDKYFTAADVPEEMQRYSEHIRNNISMSRVELGMTKESVLLAAGCPPIAGSKKTYNMSLQDIMQTDNWIYYRSRLKKVLVKFADGKVTSVEE